MKTALVNFIQMIGTQRSGSNLLRVMLNQSNDVEAPHPPHILKVFFPLLRSYGDLSDKMNLKELAADILKLVECNPVPWKKGFTDTQSMMSNVKHQSLAGLFGILYQQLAAFREAHTVCCKSLHNVFYHHQMEEAGLDPSYIHIYRDGRDVAASFRNTLVGPKHIYLLAKKWAEEQDACLKLKEQYGEQRLIQVKYEDLLNHPEEELNRICGWLGINYTPKMLNYYRSEASLKASSSGSMWQNLSKPLLRENIGKYRTGLNSEEIEIFEMLAGDQLRALGYQCPVRKRISYSRKTIQLFEEEDRAMSHSVLAKALPRDIVLRQQYEECVNELTEKANRKTEICQ